MEIQVNIRSIENGYIISNGNHEHYVNENDLVIFIGIELMMEIKKIIENEK